MDVSNCLCVCLRPLPDELQAIYQYDTLSSEISYLVLIVRVLLVLFWCLNTLVILLIICHNCSLCRSSMFTFPEERAHLKTINREREETYINRS